MIVVTIPTTFQPERKYILRILLEELLGLPYQLLVAEQDQAGPSIPLLLQNGRRLWLSDHFFNRFEDGLSYLNTSMDTIRVQWISSEFAPESKIPVWLGTGHIVEEQGDLYCDIDIIAACFFMLTLWEETANTERDKHDRFISGHALAHKYGFMNRPIVNEMAEMLWNMLRHMGYNGERKRKTFELVITHDVDAVVYWKDVRKLFASMARDLLMLKPVSLLRNMDQYFKVRNGIEKDPYDTFDWLMDLSESVGVQSRFYFKSGGTTKHDNLYCIDNMRMKKLFSAIKERGHLIGFHPSYDTYMNESLFMEEKVRLEEAAQIQVTEGRQHYLRFNAPHTWSLWERAGMKIDSSAGYPDYAGFRCGICQSFQTYDILSRSELRLREMPLVVMEASLAVYQDMDPQDMLHQMNSLLATVRKYQGQYVLLWHNDNFNHVYWKPYKSLYESFMWQGGGLVGQHSTIVARSGRLLG